MVLKISSYALGIFAKRKQVEAALRELKDSGFPLDKISVFATAWIKAARYEADGMISALANNGIPEDRAMFYKSLLLQGNFVLMLETAKDEVGKAEDILRRQGIEELGVY